MDYPGSPTMGRWWLARDDEELGQLALSTARAIDEATLTRQHQTMVSYAMYGDETAVPAHIQLIRVEQMAHNVISGIADTIVSELTQTTPRPMFYTVAGSYKQRKNAEKLTSACDCAFERNKMDILGPDVLLDAVLAGCGFFHIVREHGEVKIQRLFPGDVLMDDRACTNVMPRSIFVRRYLDRAMLWETWPDHRDRIESCPIGASLWNPHQQTADVIEVFECYHLPSCPEADDGVRCLVIDGACLERDEWTRDTYPVVGLRVLLPRRGYWGPRLIDRGKPSQLELNKTMKRVQEGHHRLAIPRVWVHESDEVTLPKKLNNTIAAICRYGGRQPPQVDTPVAFGAETYNYLDRLVGYAHQATGISELSVSSQIPAGMAGASGRSQRIYREHQSRRLVNPDRLYGDAHCDVAEQWVFAEADCAEEYEGRYEVTAKIRGNMRKIPWSDIAKDLESMGIKVAPTSGLAKTPAARMEDIQELVKEGVIPPQDALRMTDDPDLATIREEQTAELDRIHMVLDDMLEGGEFTAPEPDMDLKLAHRLCIKKINMAIVAGADEDDIAKLRQWYPACQALLEGKATGQPDAPMGAPPPGPGPEMPPGPPMGPPGMGPPMGPPGQPPGLPPMPAEMLPGMGLPPGMMPGQGGMQ